MSKFYRFPHTPYIKWLGSAPLRDDKVLTQAEVEDLLSKEVIVEEKIDGANIGLSLDENKNIRIQNRGDYLIEPYIGQFTHLPIWLERNKYQIRQHLAPNMIVFGEWCAARHSLDYTNLPDYYLLFDIFDKETKRFWSSDRRNLWAQQAGLNPIRRVSSGIYSIEDLLVLLSEAKSYYREGSPEGIVIRRDTEAWNIGRGKLVQLEFSQTIINHWSSRPMQWNRVIY